MNDLGRTLLRYGTPVVVLHAVGILLLLSFRTAQPSLFALGLLAYAFGLRHAFDADHIAVIDNSIRKLLGDRTDPSGVGLFFSLGHATVVCLLTLATVFAMTWIQVSIPGIQHFGTVFGTLVSALFLLLIAGINVGVFAGLVRAFQVYRGGGVQEPPVDQLLNKRGFIARLPWVSRRVINRSWHLYPIGFLFGLGFDTASEIALLTLSVSSLSRHLSPLEVLCLPVLFAAGMSLLDTADGLFMVNAYQWALTTHVRKLYYNLCVTGLSVAAACGIGFIEVAQVVATTTSYPGRVWEWCRNVSLGSLGYVLCGLFVLTWLLAMAVWRWFRLDDSTGPTVDRQLG